MKNLILFIFGISFGNVFAGCEKPAAGYDSTYCMAKLFVESDNELNNAYKNLSVLLNPEQKKKLIGAQRSWIKFRNAKCSDGGTIMVDCNYDVNNPETYVDYYKASGPNGCQTTPARGYTMNIQQSNAPYTKTLHQPKDASDYTLRVQRRCQDPVGFQKPFPYAVQTGTGVLRGGISVSNVASACNTSNTTTVPPDWYTGAAILKADGTKSTLEDQLNALKKRVIPGVTFQVFDDLFLRGTTGN